MLPKPSDRTFVRYLLMEGLGAEDIHVIAGFKLDDIQGEIRAMRKLGELARLYADKARRSRG